MVWSVLSEWVWVISKFNGTSTPKGSYRAKTGDNDWNVNSSRYILRTALCESICYQAKSEQNVRIRESDVQPLVAPASAANLSWDLQTPLQCVARHGEAALMHPCGMDYKIR